MFICLVSFSQNKTGASHTKRKTPERSYGFRSELTRGPYLQLATSHSMMIRWRTDLEDISIVRYGNSSDRLDKIVKDTTKVTEHIVTITGLQPETKYFYLIESAGDTLQNEDDNYFMTLPSAGKKGLYRIGVFGDCGENSSNQRKVRDFFLKYLGNNYLNAWILLGDNAYAYGKDAEFQSNFFNSYETKLLRKYPLFPAPGNHDYHDEYTSAEMARETTHFAYYQSFSMPLNGEAGGVPSNTQAFYSFDIGNIHFLSLDSHGEQDNNSRMSDTLGRQARWVKQDLEANKNKDWIIAYWHHPPYSMGSHNSDEQDELVDIRKNFIPILERYGVDLVLCGHSHDYERSKLMKGHFGPEPSFDGAKYNLSSSSGMYNGTKNSCPYIKDPSNQGTIYVVSGSAGMPYYTQKSFPHAAMPYANAKYGGSVMLEIQDNRLDLKWICSDGLIRDQFTMMKEVNKKTIIKAKMGETITLTASFIGKYQWNRNKESSRSIKVSPSTGISVFTVQDPESCLKDTFEVQVSQ